MKYRVNPAGVGKTLKATAADAKEFETILTPVQGDATAASTACGSPPITAALEGLFVHENTQLTGMATRIKACISGAAAATTAYNQGDLEMMRTYQTNAAHAKISELPGKH